MEVPSFREYLSASGEWVNTELSSPSLVVGNAEELPLSILAYGAMVGTDDPAFELLDRERGTTYWVRVVPTPRTARVLIHRYGGPPEEQRGKPRAR